ncbi:MAG: hypothetical protein KBT15_00920 [Bacteroidales bacterium]|nr:hypothetical protein [Candidatus Minthousia equi]
MRKVWNFFKNFRLHFDRSFSESQVKQIYWLSAIVGIMFLLLVGLSLIPGLYEIPPQAEGHGRILDILFLLFDPGNFTDGMSGVFILIVALVGIILFIGCLISVISNILNNRVEKIRNGETWYELENHIVIIGFNDSVPSLIHSLYEKNELIRKGEAFILLMSEQRTEDIRASIHVANTEAEERCVLVIRGQRTALDELQKLSLPKCNTIYILGEPNEKAHDSINLECLTYVANLLPEKIVGLPTCFVQFNEQTLFSIFQFSNISPDILKRLNFAPYNFCDVWAQKVLVKCEAEDGLIGSDLRINYRPIDGENGIRKDSDKHVHLVVVGMSQMGIALAVQAAHIAHFPNFKENDNTTRTHITFIDNNIGENMRLFMMRFRSMFQLARWRYVEAANANYTLEDASWHNPLEDEDSKSPYKHLGPNFIDLQWEFIDGSVDMPAIQDYLLEACSDTKAITTLAFCQDNQDVALRDSLYLPSRIYDITHQILIYQNQSPAIIHNLSGLTLEKEEQKKLRFQRMYPFGMDTEFHVGDLDSETYGMLVNVAYGYNPDDGLEGLEKLLADAEFVEKEWNAISMSNKWSSTYSANMRYVKLRFMGCDMQTSSIDEIKEAIKANIEDVKVTEHNRWNVEKLLMGFRPLTKEECGASKQEKKVLRKSSQLAHLDICSYEQLQQIDPGTIIYDASVNMALPAMIEIVRNIKAKN